jgi:hypothetical protein
MKVPKVNLPATLPYPDSSETVTKGQNNVIKMGAYNRLKPRTLSLYCTVLQRLGFDTAQTMPCLKMSFMGQEIHWLLKAATTCSMILCPSLKERVLVQPKLCAAIVSEVFVLCAATLMVYFEPPID